MVSKKTKPALANQAGKSVRVGCGSDGNDLDRKGLARARGLANSGGTKQVFSVLAEVPLDAHRNIARQEFNPRRKDWHCVRVSVIARGVPQRPLQEHARALTDLQHWVIRAVVLLTPMRRRVQLHVGQIGGIADLVQLAVGRDPLDAYVLACQYIAIQVHGDGVGFIHPTLLSQAGCWAGGAN